MEKVLVEIVDKPYRGMAVGSQTVMSRQNAKILVALGKAELIGPHVPGGGQYLRRDMVAAAPGASVAVDKISEAAAEFAKENGVDLAVVTGTGKDGRITKPDIQAVIDARQKAE